jgi:hypothetical protein
MDNTRDTACDSSVQKVQKYSLAPKKTKNQGFCLLTTSMVQKSHFLLFTFDTPFLDNCAGPANEEL